MIFQALVNSHNEDLASETSPCTNGRSILLVLSKISQLMSKSTLAETVETVIQSASSRTIKKIAKKP